MRLCHKSKAHKKQTNRCPLRIFVQSITRDSGHNAPCTGPGQVSWLIHRREIRAFPAWRPVTYSLTLRNYSDEFVQDLHLFPFSPGPFRKNFGRPTPAVCSVFNFKRPPAFVLIYHKIRSLSRADFRKLKPPSHEAPSSAVGADVNFH